MIIEMYNYDIINTFYYVLIIIMVIFVTRDFCKKRANCIRAFIKLAYLVGVCLW